MRRTIVRRAIVRHPTVRCPVRHPLVRRPIASDRFAWGGLLRCLRLTVEAPAAPAPHRASESRRFLPAA